VKAEAARPTFTGELSKMADELGKDSPIAAVELEQISQCKRRIKFTVSDDQVKKELEAAYEKVKDTARIPGFRPGKAPRHVLEMRMGKAFRETALSRIRELALGQAAVDHKLRIVSSPQFENIVYEKGSPFTFEVTMEVIPDITLPEYKGIKIERKSPPPTTDAEVSLELDRLRERFAELKPAENRAVRDGDIAVMTYEEEADGQTEKFERRSVEMAEEFVLPGFIEKVRGMKPGERREFQIHVPDDYPGKEAAGKVVDYRLQLDEIMTRVPPQADDEFAKRLRFESLESLQKHIRTQMTEDREKEAEQQEITQIIIHLLKNTDFELPESLLAEETTSRARRKAAVAHRAGVPIEQIREKRDKLIKDAAVDAFGSLKSQIILLKIAESEGIEVSDAEVEARIERLASASNVEKEALKKRYREENRFDDVRQQMLEQKVVSFLHNSAIKE